MKLAFEAVRTVVLVPLEEDEYIDHVETGCSIVRAHNSCCAEQSLGRADSDNAELVDFEESCPYKSRISKQFARM